MAKVEVETTEEQFAWFKDEVEYWIYVFGIKDYTIKVRHRELEEEYNTAQCAYNTSSRSVVIELNKTWRSDMDKNVPDETDIRRIAFHEVFHVLLLNISDIAFNFEIGYSERQRLFDQAIHAHIKMMENTLFEEHKRKEA